MELLGNQLRVGEAVGQHRHRACGHGLHYRDAEELVKRGADHHVGPTEQRRVVPAWQVADLYHPVAEPVAGLGELPGIDPGVLARHGHLKVDALVGQFYKGPEHGLRILIVVPAVVPQHQRRSPVAHRSPGRHVGQLDAHRNHVGGGPHHFQPMGVGLVGSPVEQ